MKVILKHKEYNRNYSVGKIVSKDRFVFDEDFEEFHRIKDSYNISVYYCFAPNKRYSYYIFIDNETEYWDTEIIGAFISINPNKIKEIFDSMQGNNNKHHYDYCAYLYSNSTDDLLGLSFYNTDVVMIHIFDKDVGNFGGSCRFGMSRNHLVALGIDGLMRHHREQCEKAVVKEHRHDLEFLKTLLGVNVDCDMRIEKKYENENKDDLIQQARAISCEIFNKFRDDISWIDLGEIMLPKIHNTNHWILNYFDFVRIPILVKPDKIKYITDAGTQYSSSFPFGRSLIFDAKK